MAVNVRDDETVGGCVLPAVLAVRPVQKPALVLALRHLPGRAADALVSAPLVRERPFARTRVDRKRDDVFARRETHPMDREVGCRLETIRCLGDVTLRLVRYVLPFDPAVGPHAHEHRSPCGIQEGAKGLHDLLEFARGTLKFQGRSLALFYEFRDRADGEFAFRIHSMGQPTASNAASEVCYYESILAAVRPRSNPQRRHPGYRRDPGH